MSHTSFVTSEWLDRMLSAPAPIILAHPASPLGGHYELDPHIPADGERMRVTSTGKMLTRIGKRLYRYVPDPERVKKLLDES